MGDLVFRCRKCEHQLFVSKDKVNFEFMAELTNRDCDNCGEQSGDCWIVDRVGDYEKEFGKYNEDEEEDDE